MEMSLEDAIKELEAESKIIICDKDLKLVIEIVLQALENSISKKKIEDKIKELNNKILKLQKENNYKMENKTKFTQKILYHEKNFLQGLLDDK